MSMGDVTASGHPINSRKRWPEAPQDTLVRLTNANKRNSEGHDYVEMPASLLAPGMTSGGGMPGHQPFENQTGQVRKADFQGI